MIFGLVCRKVNAARSKIATVTSLVLLTSLFVSISVRANAAAYNPTSTTVSGETVVTFSTIGSCDWEVPNGVVSARVLVVGGGSSGGAGVGGLWWPQGGGGGAVVDLAANLIEGAFSSPEAFLKWSFVVMALPGFILHYLDAISDEPETDWKTTENGRKLYRAGGVVIFILMVLVVSGVDIAGWLVG